MRYQSTPSLSEYIDGEFADFGSDGDAAGGEVLLLATCLHCSPFASDDIPEVHLAGEEVDTGDHPEEPEFESADDGKFFPV